MGFWDADQLGATGANAKLSDTLDPTPRRCPTPRGCPAPASPGSQHKHAYGMQSPPPPSPPYDLIERNVPHSPPFTPFEFTCSADSPATSPLPFHWVAGGAADDVAGGLAGLSVRLFDTEGQSNTPPLR